MTSETDRYDDQDFLDGHVACVTGDSIAAEFPAFFEIWERDQLAFDSNTGVWRPLDGVSGLVTDRL
jgi:hypothetical protein